MGRPFIAAISQRSFKCHAEIFFGLRSLEKLPRGSLRCVRPHTRNLVALRLPSFLGGTLRWKVVLSLETKQVGGLLVSKDTIPIEVRLAQIPMCNPALWPRALF